MATKLIRAGTFGCRQAGSTSSASSFTAIANEMKRLERNRLGCYLKSAQPGRKRGRLRSSRAARSMRIAQLAIVAVLAVGSAPAQSGTKEIAMTIDDLPLNGPHFELSRLQGMTDRLLSGIQRHHLPVVGFVNESLVYVPGETDARIAILRSWSDGGVELGNHTFAHVGFKDTPLAAYEDDFVRGDSVIRSIMAKRGTRPRFFRHPFLQMGPTKDDEQSFDSFIAARGYRIAPITIDIMDWMFRVAYVNARTKNDTVMMKQVADGYLSFAGLKIDFCERVTAELFGRPVKHI